MYEKKLRRMFAETKEQAEKALDEGRKKQAAQLYEQCGSILSKIADQYEGDLKKKRQKIADSYFELSDNLLGKSDSLKEKEVTAGGEGEDDFSNYAERFREQTRVTWDDVAGMEETKRDIKETFALSAIEQKPAGVEGIHTILLYGPPGTGKTLLASALAGSQDYPFFNVRLGQALSKYYGESEKILSALFDTAREEQPAIVFFDEFDSLAMARGGSMDEATRRVLSTILTELSGINKEDEDLMVLAATNAPWDLDPAVLSRIERIVHVPLPDHTTAKRILALNTTEKDIGVNVDMAEIAEKCVAEKYSGREVRNLAREAIRHMVREENPELTSLLDRPAEEIKQYELNTRPLQKEDFDHAFDKIDAKADAALVKRYEEWAQGFER